MLRLVVIAFALMFVAADATATKTTLQQSVDGTQVTKFSYTGSVSALTSTNLTLGATSGTYKISRTAKTLYVHADGTSATAAELKVGMSVTVSGTGTSPMTATKIQFR